jgi:hypothetical protein
MLTRSVDSRAGSVLEYDQKREEKTVENLQLHLFLYTKLIYKIQR